VADQSFSDQWTEKALDTVDTVVATVTDKAVRPAIVAARGVVFGFIIAVVAVVIVTLICVGFFRLLVVYLPGHHVWAAYLGLGFLFCVGGAILYSRRGSPTPASD
jgi:uncharacterized protein YacL